MNYKYILAGIAAALTLAACTNSDLEVEHKISLTIHTSDLVSNFTPYSPSDLEMPTSNGQTARLRIKAFIYDESGNLVKTFEDSAEDYGSTATFEGSIKAAAPTVVVVSYCTVGNATSYVVTGESTLSSLRVTTDNSWANIKWRTLGGYVGKMSNSSTSMTITLKPLGGLVYVLFNNLHARDGESPAPDEYRFWRHSNDQVSVVNGVFSYGTTLASSYDYFDSSKPSDHVGYTASYDILFVQPGTFNAYCSTSIGSSYTFSDNKSITVQAGKQYVAVVNCPTNTLSFREGTMY